MREPGVAQAAEHDHHARRVSARRRVHAREAVHRTRAATCLGTIACPLFAASPATIKPTPDSDIKFEVWMPLTGWNGKFQAVGNGVWSGQIWRPMMAQALARGYATANTDTGHEGDGMDASFALGHPEKVIDFGYRAVHEMTVKSKAIIASVLRQRPAPFVLERLLLGREAGAQGSAAFPARLRRHHRRRAREFLDSSDGQRRVDGAGDAQGSRQLHPAGQIPGHAHARCSKRATRSMASKTACSTIRGGADSTRGVSRAQTPTARAV